MAKVKIKNVSNCVYSVAGVALLPDAAYEFDDDVAIKWGLDSAFMVGDLKVVSGKLQKPEQKADANLENVDAIPIIAAEPEDEVEYDPYAEHPEEDVPEEEDEAEVIVIDEPVVEAPKPKRTRKTVSKAED